MIYNIRTLSHILTISCLTGIAFGVSAAGENPEIPAPADREGHATEIKNEATAPADTDDAKTTILDELVVKGKRIRVEGEKIILIPDENEKKHSTDFGSFLQQIDVPFIKLGSNGHIENMNGESVGVFINGRPASYSDLVIFWPKMVKSVEYIENPTDERFRGIPRVANFIMTEYEWGGITQLSADQSYPWMGSYKAASKFTYKKMTYVASGGYTFLDRDDVREKTDEIFRDIYYDGKHYDTITKQSDLGDNRTKFDQAAALFAADYYNGSNISISHKASFQWERHPWISRISSVSYVPKVIDASGSSLSSYSKTLNAAATGRYYFRFSPQAGSLYIDWRYQYSHNGQDSEYKLDNLEAIVNSSRENVHAVSASAQYSVDFCKKFNLSVGIPFEWKGFDTKYFGSTHTTQHINQYEPRASLRLAWNPTQKFSVSVNPSVGWYIIKVGSNDRTTNFSGGATINARYSANDKNFTSMSASYSTWLRGAAQYNDVLRRQTELLWLEGNPALKSQGELSFRINHTWMPSDVMDVSGLFTWKGCYNTAIASYRKPDDHRDGLIKSYANGPMMGDVGGVLTISLRPFRNFRIVPSLEYSYYYMTGDYHRTLHAWQPGVQATYYLGNFSFQGMLHIPGKQMSDGGHTIAKDPLFYRLGCSYGNTTWYASVELTDFCQARSKRTVTTTYDNYTAVRTVDSPAFQINVSLTYTIGYGKPIDRSIQTAGGLGGETSVLSE